MKPRELRNLGVPKGEAMKAAVACIATAAASGLDKEAIRTAVREVTADPATHQADGHFGPMAKALIASARLQATYTPRAEPAPWRQWGRDLEPSAVAQLHNACSLPVSVAGALMPDAHQGYGLPIGGVVATENSVITFAVSSAERRGW